MGVRFSPNAKNVKREFVGEGNDLERQKIGLFILPVLLHNALG